MITGKDLMNIDKFLDERGRIKIPGDTEEYKDLLINLRKKIAKELNKIKINIYKGQ